MRRWKKGDEAVLVCPGYARDGDRCRVVAVLDGMWVEFWVEFDDGFRIPVYEDNVKPVPALQAMRESVHEG